uniref:Leucine-rich repeat-containing N-terminal plant-type domain-containing protein n=1 Tax=Leptocylindrus danicus TaxID=163516 RepID=A0A7S2NT60_9STRA|mmetsp:Transcript_11715/g.17678  ORF Transcript_11715/g.17678 Transcript_11715/m.17678 type:complete len:1028 (+) Transcript_11715:115-3198(+)
MNQTAFYFLSLTLLLSLHVRVCICGRFDDVYVPSDDDTAAGRGGILPAAARSRNWKNRPFVVQNNMGRFTKDADDALVEETEQATLDPAEYQALEELYHATNGNQWHNNDNWLNGGFPCNKMFRWHGVYCKEENLNATVNNLVLSDNGLRGTLPSEALASLSNLSTVGLHNNTLSGTIPTEIGSLEKLRYLWLQENRLTGTIPTGIINALSNSIPPNDSTSKNTLRVESNILTGAIMDCESILITADCGGQQPKVICDCCYMCYTSAPTPVPSFLPTAYPSSIPTVSPSALPSAYRSNAPSHLPSDVPSVEFSDNPSRMPSSSPTSLPSGDPSNHPSNYPSDVHSNAPTDVPSESPSQFPSWLPSYLPSYRPSVSSSSLPSYFPTILSSFLPSLHPSVGPSHPPSISSSNVPSLLPTAVPSSEPSLMSSAPPSNSPSIEPSILPTSTPSIEPTREPSFSPSQIPTSGPSVSQSKTPSSVPSSLPSQISTSSPNASPSQKLSNSSSVMPTLAPTSLPSNSPSIEPSKSPTFRPSTLPSITSSTIPSVTPSTVEPTSLPTPVHSHSPSNGVTVSVGVGTAPTHMPSISPSLPLASFIFSYEFNSATNLEDLDAELQDYFDSIEEDEEHCNGDNGRDIRRRLGEGRFLLVNVLNVNSIVDNSRPCSSPSSSTSCSSVSTTIEVHYDKTEFDEDYARLLILSNFLGFMEIRSIDVTLIDGDGSINDETAKLSLELGGIESRLMSGTEQAELSESILEFLREQWALSDPPIHAANVTFLSQTILIEDEGSRRNLNENITANTPVIGVTVIVEGYYMPPPDVEFDEVIVESFMEEEDAFVEILNNYPSFENASVAGVSAISMVDAVKTSAAFVTESTSTFGPFGKEGTMGLAIAGWTILWGVICYMVWIKCGASPKAKKKWIQKSIPAVNPATSVNDSGSCVNDDTDEARDEEKGYVVKDDGVDDVSSLSSMIPYDDNANDEKAVSNKDLKHAKNDSRNDSSGEGAFSSSDLRGSYIGAPDISDGNAYCIGPI